MAPGTEPPENESRDSVELGVAAIVLCAGEGSRFFGNNHKLLAPFRGKPLAAWAVQSALDARLAAVVVVEGAVDLSSVMDCVGPGATLVTNPDWRRGQASSLRAGLDWCEANGFRAAVVGLGDQPLTTPAAWRIVALADHSPIVTATFGGHRRPPVRLDAAVWPLVGVDGDEGARELMRRRPDLVGEVACEGSAVDVDTVEDLGRLVKGDSG